VDAEVLYRGEEDTVSVSLRKLLPQHFQTKDGMSPLFAKIHQQQNGAPVEVVIPNTKEAEAMLGNVNRHVPAFIKFYLEERGLWPDLITRLIIASCCPSDVAKLTGVTWDSTNQIVVTPADVRDKESLEAFALQDWYFDLEKLRVSPRKKKAHKYTAPEALFNLDADRSVVTLHMKNDAKRAAAKDGYGEVNSEEEDDTDSASDTHTIGKSPDGKADDDKGGDGQKLISWSPSDPSDGHPASRLAAGGG
jgi:hypothetical protein